MSPQQICHVRLALVDDLFMATDGLASAAMILLNTAGNENHIGFRKGQAECEYWRAECKRIRAEVDAHRGEHGC